MRIIQTYAAAGDGKGTIDGMPSFGVKNILRKGIFTYDVFFNTSEDIVDYLTIKCPQFNYTHFPSEDVWYAMIIKDCMKQHLMIFAPNEPVFCKEYPCSCNTCLWFDFKECSRDDVPVYAELPCNNYCGDDEEVDAIDKSIYLIFYMFHRLSRFLVKTKMKPFISSRLKKKAQLKKILLTHMVFSLVMMKSFWTFDLKSSFLYVVSFLLPYLYC